MIDFTLTHPEVFTLVRLFQVLAYGKFCTGEDLRLDVRDFGQLAIDYSFAASADSSVALRYLLLQALNILNHCVNVRHTGSLSVSLPLLDISHLTLLLVQKA